MLQKKKRTQDTGRHNICSRKPRFLHQKMGNLHVIARPLRQALYSRLASVTVVEIFPVWNSDLNDVVFEETKVDPDKSLDHLLDDPAAALKWLTTNDIALPPSIGEARHSQEWRSYARSMIVAELYFTAHIAASPNSRNLIDSVSIAKSIDSYHKKRADFLPSIANPWPRGVPVCNIEFFFMGCITVLYIHESHAIIWIK